MRGATARAIGVVVTLALLGVPAASPAAAAASVTGLFLDGEPGEYVSAGDQWMYLSPRDTITSQWASPNHDFVTFNVADAWGVSIDAPAGQSLVAGSSFPALNGILPAGTGVLSVAGNGRGCTLADGFVSILQAEFDGSGNVSAFAADFWMDCDDANTARLHGSIRYHSLYGLKAISVDRDTVDFGDEHVGTPSSTEVVTITNGGSSAVQFDSPRFEGPAAGDFEIVGTPCSVVLAGNTCTVSVRLDAAARGAKQADLVLPDSTLRGERRIQLQGTAFQPTTTTIVVNTLHPDSGFGPEVTVTVSPNPGPEGVSLSWTGAGGPGDPGGTGGALNAATGSYAHVPLGMGPGTWTITANFQRQDYWDASSAQIVGLVMPLSTWLTFTSISPSVPGGTAYLHAAVNTVFSEPLTAGTLTIRDTADNVVATKAVGGTDVTLDTEVCCLPIGDYDYTAAYVPNTGAAFGATASLTHLVRDPLPYGTLYLEGGAPWTPSPIVPIHFETQVLFGVVSKMQISNDGIHWHDHDLLNNFDWDLTDPAFEGFAGDGRHIVSARWATAESDWGPIATASIELDRGLPTSSAPQSSVTASSTTTGGSATVALRWTGTDDRSGVDHYELARSIDGHSYASISAAIASPSITQLLASGHTYRFRIRPVDKAGNTGAWSYGSTFKLTGVSQSSSAVHYFGRWSSSTSTSTWWGGTAKWSASKGATVSYRFTGRSIAWVGLKATTRGKANVYINGILKATVNLYSATTRKQVVVWSANYATSATRTITIKVLGTSGRPRVDIDGFIVGS